MANRLLPARTRGRDFFRLLAKGGEVLLREGLRSFCQKSSRKILSLARALGFRIKDRFGGLLIGSGSKRMRIAAVTMVYNEALLLPFFLRHYRYLDEILVLYETDTTDGSLEILKQAPNVVIKFCHIEGGIDDIEKVNLINNALHHVAADWVYVVDPDEFVFPRGESPYHFLRRQRGEVVRSTLFQVYRHRNDADLDARLPPVPQRVHGDPDVFSTVQKESRPANAVYVKPNVVRPSSGVRFVPGNHDVDGNPRISDEFYVGAHWQMADLSIALRRRMERKARISERNKALQMGWQHFDVTEERIRVECEHHLDDPIIDALLSFREEDLRHPVSEKRSALQETQ
jgi:hypothetical protein